MEDKVTKFGNCAHNMVERVQKMIAIYPMSHDNVSKDYADTAVENLQYFEDMCSQSYQDGCVEGLVNLAVIGMCGFLYMTNSNDANALANQMTDLYARKNRDYGNSFDKSMDKHGLVVAAIRIGDKVNRLQSLVAKRGEAEVKDESIADTFIDLACYSIMTLMWMEGKANGKCLKNEYLLLLHNTNYV